LKVDAVGDGRGELSSLRGPLAAPAAPVDRNAVEDQWQLGDGPIQSVTGPSEHRALSAVDKVNVFSRKCGAGDVTRTRDLLITNQLLYQLSYAGLGVENNRF
jgi:hypothetical protein